MREHGTLHVPDIRAQNEFPLVSSDTRLAYPLSVPLRQQEELIGHLSARRTEARPFTPAQIKLLETFADQAVIALENVRLFQELKESLEQQTATGAGRFWASSPVRRRIFSRYWMPWRKALCGWCAAEDAVDSPPLTEICSRVGRPLWNDSYDGAARNQDRTVEPRHSLNGSSGG